MSSASLREIEKTLTKLWMSRDARESFLKGNAGEIDPKIAAQIDKDGVELYATLLNYGHQDVMRSIYPFTARLLGSAWQSTVDHYLAQYPPNHFNLNRTAMRFSAYLQEHGARWQNQFPFLCELVDYEWVEMELLEIDAEPPVSELCGLQSPEQFTQYAPILNPALILRHYRYPMIKIVSQLETSKRLPRNVSPVETNVVIYRDPQNNNCRFLEVGPTAAMVLEKVHENVSYAELIQLAVSLNAGADPQKVVADFIGMIENFQDIRVFLGNRKAAGAE